ncbi:hypothetical protein M407DRAFT_69379 [Tulasnella calospora MUT 4182]|uniref:Photolyase/cryptochrome alpha/beta domain-containing protein n=1 Tax=Tulasnella calospora MUT 4182 TaxID=1051891 RepID=A0A0C3M921_9AGAM|nr:hypothetical protein M407DRAFT_69379 [Tulasnella calospora MUT 4182]
MLDKPQENGDAVVYWMRMQDMRILDNRALEGASKCARERGIPLLVVFLFSVGDYRAHDRSPRRVDFVLRNLNILKDSLAELHIPLHTFTVEKRKTVPNRIKDLMNEWDVKDLFINVEYEVDELRRDLKLLELSTAAGIRCSVYHDRCLVQPGQIKTKDGKMSSIYTPWMKQWSSAIQSHPDYFKEACAPVANDPSVHKHSMFGPLFHDSIPDAIPGFECEDADKMAELWPAGTDAALKKSANLGDTRIGQYEDQRVRLDMDSSSRLSPYLATGAICARQCVRAVMKKHSNDTFNASRGSGPGVWIQEIGWRDFYTHIMAAYPRVSMGRPYHEKYADVFWEEDVDGKILEAWKEGKTGYPIVDAAMRQCKTQGMFPAPWDSSPASFFMFIDDLILIGYMHNRARMIAAMFLTKDLMIDWRLGERHFMRSFLDGDLGSNNGGWQWCASTGTDPQPWFRIFNPYLQSEKADPQGDYIRHFVPELRKLDNKGMPAEFEKLGYPKPIVDHKFARDRAIRRFKNVGEE